VETQRFLRLRELFDQALAVPEDKRERFLAVASGGDAKLLAEVRALLEAKDQAGTFLEGTSTAPPPLFNAAPPTSPERIGRYRVIRELGRGGMGVVFLAVRDDGTFTKKVALKLIKEGIRDEEALGRFRAERQVLAALDHPNIARILDGGDTQAGTPYYVMEYVEGEPLDAYCTRKDLELEARLRLFQQVCSAVNYLHGMQVLHRDLKPNNILIANDGVVKLLDFGIAKFLGLGAIDLTTSGRAPLTPAYASPEQLAGHSVGSAADVYSLGVILYLLLTDNLPNRVKIEVPSKCLSPRAEHMKRRISRDLDMILLKALELDPDHRYCSPEEFSADLQRFLDNRTVLARPTSLPVRISKLLRRNRVRTAVGAVVLLLAATGSWLAADAIRQRRDVSAKEAKIQGLLDSISHSPPAAEAIDPSKVEQIIGEVRRLRESLESQWMDSGNLSQGQAKLRKEVLDRSRQYLSSLQQVSDRSPKVAREIGFTYFRLGELEQSNRQPQISNRTAAVASFKAAAQTLTRAVELDPRDTDLPQRLAEVERRLETLGAGAVTKPAEPAGSPEAAAKANVDPSTAGRGSRVSTAAPASTPGPRQSSTAPVIEEFRADLSSVRPGQAVRLHWAVTGDVNEISLTPGGPMPVSANTIIVNPTTTTNYVLTAMGHGPTVGKKLQIEVIPYPPPLIEQFVAEPRSVAPGQPAKLSWSTSGEITSLTVTPGRPLTPQDSALEVTPEETTGYKLEARGPGGSISQSVTIEVVRRADSAAKALPGTVRVIGANSGPEAESAFSEAQLKVRSKKYEEAAVLFGKAARLKTDWKDPLVERGKMNNKLGRFREAIEDFNQALVIDPSDASVLNDRGFAYKSLNQIKEAMADFDRAIQLKPDLADAYQNRGNLKWWSGDKVTSKADFDMYRSLRNAKTRR
jgi:serine/threonine protein kinase